MAEHVGVDGESQHTQSGDFKDAFELSGGQVDYDAVTVPDGRVCLTCFFEEDISIIFSDSIFKSGRAGHDAFPVVLGY